MLEVEIEYNLKRKFRYEICKNKGGWVGDVLGGVTGGLIGNDPNEAAKKEAKRQREEAERLAKEQEETRKKEETFNKNVEQDTTTMANQQVEEQKKRKPTTSVDFSNAIKGYEGETDEDKLKKAFKNRR